MAERAGSSESVRRDCASRFVSNHELVDSRVVLRVERSAGWKRVYRGPVGLGWAVVVLDFVEAEAEADAKGSCSRSSRSGDDDGDSPVGDEVVVVEEEEACAALDE